MATTKISPKERIRYLLQAIDALRRVSSDLLDADGDPYPLEGREGTMLLGLARKINAEVGEHLDGIEAAVSASADLQSLRQAQSALRRHGDPASEALTPLIQRLAAELTSEPI